MLIHNFVHKIDKSIFIPYKRQLNFMFSQIFSSFLLKKNEISDMQRWSKYPIWKAVAILGRGMHCWPVHRKMRKYLGNLLHFLPQHKLVWRMKKNGLPFSKLDHCLLCSPFLGRINISLNSLKFYKKYKKRNSFLCFIGVSSKND